MSKSRVYFDIFKKTLDSGRIGIAGQALGIGQVRSVLNETQIALNN